MNLINGVNLQQAANAVYDIDRRDDLNSLKDGDVIWCKTDYLYELFNQIKDRKEKFKLITHCSDYSITEILFTNKPKCITKWFAENVDYKHPDLIPVPLGVENHFTKNKGSNTDFDVLVESVKNKHYFTDKISNKVFCNFRPTHLERREATHALLKTGVGYFYPPTKDYTTYCEHLKMYLYIACPRGNGIDTHRLWETLYHGNIPIVKKHFMYDTYCLPIIQVNSWEEVTEELLIYPWHNYEKKEFNFEQLELNYWLNKIQAAV